MNKLCVFLLLVIAGCSSAPQVERRPTLADCRSLCNTEKVAFYKDDSVECKCQESKDHTR